MLLIVSGDAQSSAMTASRVPSRQIMLAAARYRGWRFGLDQCNAVALHRHS